MNVLMIDPSLYTPPYDGALGAALRARGHRVSLVGRRPRPTDPPLGGDVALVPLFYRAAERIRGPAPVRQLAKGVEHRLALARLARLVAAERPDVVHWQWPSLPWLDAGALARLAELAPQVVTVHDARVFKAKTGLRRAMGLGWPRFVAGADVVIAHVEATRRTLATLGVDPARVQIVPHPVFARPDGGAPRPPRPPRPAGAPVRALFFGRLADDKGVDVLAGALEQVSRPGRWEVRVAGPRVREDARTAAALERLARLPHVRLDVGFLPEPELDAALAATDLVILPHREVDASGALMKALGYDVGVVAADVPGFAEVLAGRDCARLFRAGDAADLARVLDELEARPALIAALAAGTARVRDGALSWARAAELTEHAYVRAQARGTRPAVAGPVRGAA